METAGRAVAKTAMDRGANAHPVILLCGTGNNGGDGLVAARVLHDQGVKVFVVVVAESENSATSLFSRQLSTLQAMAVTTATWSPGAITALRLSRPIIIDAVSGLGFKPPCEGTMLQALTEAAAIADATVIAVDIPSGMSPDDGSVQHAPLAAHETVTFGASRPVHRIMPAASCCGNVSVVDIGFPHAAVQVAVAETKSHWQEVNPQTILHIDPWHQLPRDAHKFDRGHVLVLGGSTGKIGAPIIAAHMTIGCSADFAAARAYTLLSRTAWIAAQDVGEDAVIVSDILDRLGIGARM